MRRANPFSNNWEVQSSGQLALALAASHASPSEQSHVSSKIPALCDSLRHRQEPRAWRQRHVSSARLWLPQDGHGGDWPGEDWFGMKPGLSKLVRHHFSTLGDLHLGNLQNGSPLKLKDYIWWIMSWTTSQILNGSAFKEKIFWCELFYMSEWQNIRDGQKCWIATKHWWIALGHNCVSMCSIVHPRLLGPSALWDSQLA